jgi:hypothetical protein
MVRATCVVEVSKLVLKPRDRSPWVEELTIKRLVKSQKYKEKKKPTNNRFLSDIV